MTASAKRVFDEVFNKEDLWTPDFFDRPLANGESLWEEPGVGALLTVETNDRFFLSLLAVHPDCRRSGVANRLVSNALELQSKPVQLGGAPGKYLFPGLYISAFPNGKHLFDHLGFKVKSIVRSMETSLGEAYSSLPEWISVPSARSREALAKRVFSHFGAEWRDIVLSAPLNQLLGASLVGEWVGFSHWDGERFGPIGVFKDFRGQRLGADLAIRTMNQMKLAGNQRAFFMWANDDLAKKFYSPLGFTVRRSFQMLERP